MKTKKTSEQIERDFDNYHNSIPEKQGGKHIHHYPLGRILNDKLGTEELV